MTAVAANRAAADDGLGAYLARALEANPGLAALAERYEAARARVPQAAALPDPMVRISVEGLEADYAAQETMLMVTQTVPWMGKRSNREESASAEAEALWHSFRARQLALMREVATAYYDYGYTAKASALTRDKVRLADELIAVAEERVRGGAGLNDLVRLKVERGRIADRLSTLEQEGAVHATRLREWLALASHEALPPVEWELPAPIAADALDLRAALERNNPELAALRLMIDSAEARREVARLQSYPDLTFGVQYSQMDSADAAMNPMPNEDMWGVSVAFNVPIWGGRNRAARAEALASQRAAEHAHAERLNALTAALESALARLEDAQRRLDLYGGELLDLARQGLEISRAAYSSGRASILEVIDSERTLLELELMHWRAAADTWQQRMIIQTLTLSPDQALSLPETQQ